MKNNLLLFRTVLFISLSFTLNSLVIFCGNGHKREDTEALCTNGKDDDDDGYIDCRDQDCFAFEFCDTDAGVDAVDVSEEEGPDISDAADIDVSDAEVDGMGCDSECECPEGMICNVDHVCVGDPCSKPCTSPADCKCGHPCSDGYCEPHIGTLSSCEFDCSCQGGEFCAGGECVWNCGFNHYRCEDDSDCEPCGQICNDHYMDCVDPGFCACGSDCVEWIPEDQVCVDNFCQQPPGDRYAPLAGLPVEFPELATTPLSLTVPPGTMVNGLIVLFDVSLDSIDLFISLRLRGPDGNTIVIWDMLPPGCKTDHFREAFPLTETPQDDLSVFEGMDGGGNWTLFFNKDGSGNATLNDWAIYIE